MSRFFGSAVLGAMEAEAPSLRTALKAAVASASTGAHVTSLPTVSSAFPRLAALADRITAGIAGLAVVGLCFGYVLGAVIGRALPALLAVDFTGLDLRDDAAVSTARAKLRPRAARWLRRHPKNVPAFLRAPDFERAQVSVHWSPGVERPGPRRPTVAALIL